MRPVRLEGKFEGWTVDTVDGVIYDEANNHYYLDEIRAIFFYRQLQKNIIGTSGDIISLKMILEKNLNEIQYPKVTIEWGSEKQIIEHPKKQF